MTSSSGIPRPFSITDAKRAREEEARKREQATSARNTSSTTIGSGGRLDVVGGDLTVSEGGNASVKDGGAFRVEGGGSMEITDDGVVKVVGSTVDDITDAVMVAEAALSTEEVYHSSSGVTTRSPGLFFKTERAEGGKVHSAWGDDVGITSGMSLVDYGPLVEPGVYKNTASRVSPSSAGLYASAFFTTTPDIADQRSQCYIEAFPDSIAAELFSVTLGRVGGINVSIADPKLRLYGRDGVDVKGPFTVDGAPVGGAVDSVAGKTGVVTLVKADVGLGNVDNTSDAAKPVSTATATALSGKASTAVATTTVNGLMASTDKSKLDGATPAPTAFRIVQRDGSGRAQIADPAVADDIANKRAVDALIPQAYAALSPAGWTAAGVLTKSKNTLGDAVNMDFNLTRTGGTLALTTAWTNIGVVIPPELRPPSGAAQHRYGFAFLAGFNVQIKMFVNADNGQVSLSALTGTQNIPATNQVFIVTSWPYI